MFSKAPSCGQIFEETVCKTYMSHVSDIYSALKTLVLCDRQGNFTAFAVMRHPERATSSSRWPITMVRGSTAIGKEMLDAWVGDGLNLENSVYIVAAVNGSVIHNTEACCDMFALYDEKLLEQKRCAVADLVRFAEASTGRSLYTLPERTASLVSKGLLAKKYTIESFKEYASHGPYSPNHQLTPGQQASLTGDYEYYLQNRIRILKNLAKSYKK